MESIMTSLTTAFTAISTNLMSVFGDIVPIALGIVGAVLVVNFGVKMFRRLTGRN